MVLFIKLFYLFIYLVIYLFTGLFPANSIKIRFDLLFKQECTGLNFRAVSLPVFYATEKIKKAKERNMIYATQLFTEFS